MQCDFCKKPLVPADARWDGEPTTVGFWPCPCSKYDWRTGTYVRKTREELERERRLEREEL